MKILIVIGIIVGIGAIIAFWPSSDCNTAHASCSDPDALSAADKILAEVQSGKALLVDVREPDEYKAGHAPQAELHPLGRIEAGEFDEADKSKKIYLYCRSGNRASIAATSLRDQGYANIENLGGLSDWQQLGGRVTQ